MNSNNKGNLNKKVSNKTRKRSKKPKLKKNNLKISTF